MKDKKNVAGSEDSPDYQRGYWHGLRCGLEHGKNEGLGAGIRQARRKIAGMTMAVAGASGLFTICVWRAGIIPTALSFAIVGLIIGGVALTLNARGR